MIFAPSLANSPLPRWSKIRRSNSNINLFASCSKQLNITHIHHRIVASLSSFSGFDQHRQQHRRADGRSPTSALSIFHLTTFTGVWDKLARMPLGLCAVCNKIVEGPLIVRQEQPHHESLEAFLEASTNCYICRTITKSPQWKEVERRAGLCEQLPAAVWYLAPHTLEVTAEDSSLVWYKLMIDHAWDDEEISPPSIASSDDLPDLVAETPVWEFRFSPSQGNSLLISRALYPRVDANPVQR